MIDLIGVTFEDNDANSGDGIYLVTGTSFADDPIVWFIKNSTAEGPY